MSFYWIYDPYHIFQYLTKYPLCSLFHIALSLPGILLWNPFHSQGSFLEKKFFFLYFFVFLFCGHQLKNYITMNRFYAGSISLLMSYEILLLSIFFFLFLRLNSFVWILLHIVHNPSQVFGNFRINARRFLSIATRFCSKWHDTVLNHVYNIIYFCSTLKWTATVTWIKNN